MEIPITHHPKLPEGVPLVADFHDMRNRLSYYFPIIRDIDTVRTPVTKFFAVDGSYDSYPDIAYREITKFLQDQQMRRAFVRGDYSSAKYDSDGREITSHDPYEINRTVVEMMRQLAFDERHVGGKIAVREWIPHDTEVRFFLRDGHILYGDSLDDAPETEWPWVEARTIAREMDTYAWSCDFIRHEDTGKWYCIDMGLDALYHTKKYGWTAHSEHLDESYSPEQYIDEMPNPEVLQR